MTQLLWDRGTEYELFASLVVLHRPYGFRGAARLGCRSAFSPPPGPRNFLEKAFSFLDVPWHGSIACRNRRCFECHPGTVRLPAAERLATLQFNANTPPEMIATCRAIASKGTWDLDDREMLRATSIAAPIRPRPPCSMHLCRAWSDPLAFGEELVLGTPGLL